MSLKKKERHEKIISLLNKKEEVSLDELKKFFPDVSVITLRRDLKELDDEGKIVRKVKSIKRSTKQVGSLRKLTDELNSIYYENIVDGLFELEEEVDNFESNYKKQIAKAAVDLIANNSRIIIDSGTTTREMINYIGAKKNLAILTNSLRIAQAVVSKKYAHTPQLLVTGGVYDPISDTFLGNEVPSILKEYNFEQLFIGADGIDFNRGTMTINEGLLYSERMADISYEVVILIESHKIGRRMRRLELPWTKIHTVITDQNIALEDVEKLLHLGVSVIIASNEFNRPSKKYQAIRRNASSARQV